MSKKTTTIVPFLTLLPQSVTRSIYCPPFDFAVLPPCIIPLSVNRTTNHAKSQKPSFEGDDEWPCRYQTPPWFNNQLCRLRGTAANIFHQLYGNGQVSSPSLQKLRY
ncbi:hypothetical protein WA026_014651 [Henosepilachna vigintioctopunctata]|uniref:Uncharacterized protein n=1 Tax=Henosepilachna vigintioctopunctata TaxID=420089 RepID=A0AAW1VDT6_9CUCU